MIIAADFDGTISLGDWPDVGPANKPVIDALLERQRAGDKIILWTCRSGDELSAAVAWCKIYGLEFDAVNANLPEVLEAWGYKDTRKIYADEYWDDKSLTLRDLGLDEEAGMNDRELKAAATGIIIYNYIEEHGTTPEPDENGMVELIGSLSDEIMEKTLEYCSYLSPNIAELEWLEEDDDEEEDDDG